MPPRIDGSAPGRIWDAEKIAADADHALLRDTTFQAQHCPERCQRQWPQMQLLLGEGFVDDPAGSRVHARVGHAVQPAAQLLVELRQIAEAAGQEEVFADVAERPLDFVFRFRPVGPACFWAKAVVAGKIDERRL